MPFLSFPLSATSILKDPILVAVSKKALRKRGCPQAASLILRKFSACGAKSGGGFAVGSMVQAQWQDGNWYPAKVIAEQSGMVGIEWANPAMGGAAWVQASQIMAK